MITKKQLMPFCSTDETLPSICQPWTRDGFTIATDGRILIRVPALADVPENAAAPDYMKSVWNSFDDKAEFAPLPSLPPIVSEKCEECGGNGISEGMTCEEYDGEGSFEKPEGMDIGSRILDALFLRKIAALTNPVIAMTGDKLSAASFKGDGFEGLLMPIKIK